MATTVQGLKCITAEHTKANSIAFEYKAFSGAHKGPGGLLQNSNCSLFNLYKSPMKHLFFKMKFFCPFPNTNCYFSDPTNSLSY